MRKLIFLLIINLFYLNVCAGEFDEKLLSKGELFFQDQKYYKAEVFFDAFLLENSSCEIAFKSALCRYYTKRYNDSLNMFSEIIENCEKEYLIPSYFFLSEIYLEINEPGLYLTSISNLEKIAQNQNLKKQILNNKVWFYLRFLKTEKALEEIKSTDEKTKSELNFSELEKNIYLLNKEKKSPLMSGVYSIIPGGGYLYCKRYKDAFFSFFINSLIAASAYEAFDNDMNVCGVLLSALGIGFYSGNIYGGIRAANVENNIYRSKVLDELEKKFKVKNSFNFKLEFKIDF